MSEVALIRDRHPPACPATPFRITAFIMKLARPLGGSIQRPFHQSLRNTRIFSMVFLMHVVNVFQTEFFSSSKIFANVVYWRFFSTLSESLYSLRRICDCLNDDKVPILNMQKPSIMPRITITFPASCGPGTHRSRQFREFEELKLCAAVSMM